MSHIRRNPIVASVMALAGVMLIVVAIYAGYLASAAGRLPWQEDPTRIPVTPFSEIPGFTPPTPLPTATPAPQLRSGLPADRGGARTESPDDRP